MNKMVMSVILAKVTLFLTFISTIE